MIVVTGGAGFIGSALIWALNERGRSDILVVDEIDHDEKERNLGALQYEELVGIKEFREKLLAGDYDAANVEAILHMGACSFTTETNWDYLEDNNVEYSKDVIRWCFDHDVRCVYASSGATYGDGSRGYSDDPELFDELEPLNLYGKSKLLVDIWARDGGYLDKVVGLRYFNVFGPNEGHKEDQRSVVAKKFEQVRDGGYIELFKSENPDYKDGEQMRDFVYVKDVVKATLYFMDNPDVAGVFNVGFGKARTWNDMARAMFAALHEADPSTPLRASIRYIDMPKNIAKQYQYHTEADISQLRAAGYTEKMTSLEEAVEDCVVNYLILDKRLGE